MKTLEEKREAILNNHEEDIFNIKLDFLNKEEIDTWIEGLISGDFKQGKQDLYNELFEEFCCLGVFERVVNKRSLEDLSNKSYPSELEGYKKEWIESSNGTQTENIFTSMNDAEYFDEDDEPIEFSFKEIAECIQKSYENGKKSI